METAHLKKRSCGIVKTKSIFCTFWQEGGVRENNTMRCSKAWEVGGLYQTELSPNPALEQPQMKFAVAFALLNIAVTGVFTLVFRKQEDRVNSFVRKTGKIQEKQRAVLSQTEDMMVREEIFLESLASKLARRENAISVGGSSDWVPRLKSFLKTFRQRPRLQTKGRTLSVHYLFWQEEYEKEHCAQICPKLEQPATVCAF